MLNLCRAAFEIVALAAGRLGSLSLSAQSVIMTTDQGTTLKLQEDPLSHHQFVLVLNTLPFGIGT